MASPPQEAHPWVIPRVEARTAARILALQHRLHLHDIDVHEHPLSKHTNQHIDIPVSLSEIARQAQEMPAGYDSQEALMNIIFWDLFLESVVLAHTALDANENRSGLDVLVAAIDVKRRWVLLLSLLRIFQRLLNEPEIAPKNYFRRVPPVPEFMQKAMRTAIPMIDRQVWDLLALNYVTRTLVEYAATRKEER